MFLPMFWFHFAGDLNRQSQGTPKALVTFTISEPAPGRGSCSHIFSPCFKSIAFKGMSWRQTLSKDPFSSSPLFSVCNRTVEIALKSLQAKKSVWIMNFSIMNLLKRRHFILPWSEKCLFMLTKKWKLFKHFWLRKRVKYTAAHQSTQNLGMCCKDPTEDNIHNFRAISTRWSY